MMVTRLMFTGDSEEADGSSVEETSFMLFNIVSIDPFPSDGVDDVVISFNAYRACWLTSHLYCFGITSKTVALEYDVRIFSAEKVFFSFLFGQIGIFKSIISVF